MELWQTFVNYKRHSGSAKLLQLKIFSNSMNYYGIIICYVHPCNLLSRHNFCNGWFPCWLQGGSTFKLTNLTVADIEKTRWQTFGLWRAEANVVRVNADIGKFWRSPSKSVKFYSLWGFNVLLVSPIHWSKQKE